MGGSYAPKPFYGHDPTDWDSMVRRRIEQERAIRDALKAVLRIHADFVAAGFVSADDVAPDDNYITGKDEQGREYTYRVVRVS